MEQRIGSSSKPSGAEPSKAEPVTGAGFDPAFIPGITGPAPTGAVPKVPKEPEQSGKLAKPEQSEEPDDAAPVGRTAEDETPEDKAPTAAEPADGGGPVFEASDRRARIVADRAGVRLSLDEESCEFRWDEIAAVETESSRFGKRLTITVHTPDRRWYPIEIEAAARARSGEWESQLDAVLDAYFEEAEDSEDTEEAAETVVKE
ncbi:hypothetical protein, partial [Streptomyces sp. NRRL S-31]|uniref:hypothetical protein n=1 Tax=Streptomyces sp. NRRL S-31 TaxID=1463898 RepID=UPI0004CB237D